MSSRIVYLNGQYLPLEQAHVSVMDRGFIFGDGVYEVIPFFNGRFFRPREHLRRLQKSMAAIKLNLTFEDEAYLDIFAQLVEKNPDQGDHRSLYVQITRGVAEDRNHVFPEHVQPTIFAQCTPFHPVTEEEHMKGASVIVVPDIRWGQCYIKATTLLANALVAQQAKEAGAKEAILVRNGMAMEGYASNLFVVKNGTLITPPANFSILHGITREVVLELADQHNVPFFERDIPVPTLHEADEIWMTGSVKEIMPVTQVGDVVINNGKIGPMWRRFYQLYQELKKGG